jgi:dienelactone hydrolase
MKRTIVRRLYLCVLSILVVAWSTEAGAQSRQERIQARAWTNLPGERVSLQSRSPLTPIELRDGTGASVQVEAHLWMPDNAKGPVPVVVIFNCGNTMLYEKEGVWAEKFHRQGYAVLIVNSLAARVPGNDITGEVMRYRYATIVDVFVALKFLAADRRIDAKRIAIMGWSNGGVSILAAAIEGLRTRHVGPKLHYAAIVAISPYCGIGTLGARYSGTPILSLHGEQDQFMPAGPCRFYRQEAVSRGAQYEMIVYPGAVHNWEMAFPVHQDRTQTYMGDCYVVTDLAQRAVRLGNGTTLAAGTANMAEIATKYVDACKKRGFAEGNHARSRADSQARITAFIQQSFAGAR